MLPLTAVQGDGRHAHEFPPMRRHLPSFLQNNAEGRRALRRTILLVDMAMTDAAFRSRMKVAKKGGAMVIMPARSDVKTIVMQKVPFDRDDPVNLGVVSCELVAFNDPESSTMHKVVYRDPETGREFIFLTTAMDLAPGLIGLLYLCRWRIEKVFDVFKNKLHEQKAWDNGTVCQQMQAHFICMTHNLLLLFVSRLKGDYGIEPLKLYKKRNAGKSRPPSEALSSTRSSRN